MFVHHLVVIEERLKQDHLLNKAVVKLVQFILFAFIHDAYTIYINIWHLKALSSK